MVRTRRLTSLIVGCVLLAATTGWSQAVAPAPPGLDLARWEPEIRAFEQADRQSPPAPGGILFAGSSSIRLWTTLREDFAGLPVLNRGFGGSQIREVTAFAERIVLPYRPRLIVFYCGANDIAAGRHASDVARDFDVFLEKVHGALPRTRVLFIAAAPNPARWHLRESMLELNNRVKAYAASHPIVTFVDIWRAMLDASGQPRPELFVQDKLHMNAQGYAIWTGILRPVVEREFKEAGVSRN